MKRIFSLLIIIAIICFVSVQQVHAWYNWVFQSWDLVDSGKHLDWDGSTSYSSAFNYGVSLWNAQISGVIRKDTALIVEDVAISDVNPGNVGWAGATSPSGTIQFNKYYMDGYGTAKRRNVTSHELGHALRLQHRSESDSIIQTNVTTITTLNSNDIAHFNYAYNNYY